MTSTTKSWNDMDYNILVKIFMAVNVADLISGVSQVCKSWNLASYDPQLWMKLDLSTLKSETLCITSQPSSRFDNVSSKRLLQVMKNAFLFSCRNVKYLIFHYFVFINDEHLICAAERSPNLKRLVLPARNNLSENGFQLALPMLEGLESLTVPCVTCYSYMLEAIGKNCRNFSELKVLCPLDIEFAESLIKHIPKLKILSLRCSLVYTEALRCILKGLEYLEVLNLSHSMFFAELDHEGAETSNILIQRGGEIPAAMDVSRLERLVACQGETSCFLCQLMLENPSVGGRGYRFQEAMWREDEISSLAH